MARSGAIAVDRAAGMKALKKMKADAVRAKATGRSIQIIRGTRVPLALMLVSNWRLLHL